LRPYIDPSGLVFLEAAFAAAETVSITRRIAACRDPPDDEFLELAVNGASELIITGDKDLLSMAAFEEIPIVNPATFLKVFYS
jgi:uncharacterized protein